MARDRTQQPTSGGELSKAIKANREEICMTVAAAIINFDPHCDSKTATAHISFFCPKKCTLTIWDSQLTHDCFPSSLVNMIALPVTSDPAFRAERQRLIDEAEANIARTNLYHNVCAIDWIGPTSVGFWYTRDDDELLYVRLIDKPGALSGNILRLLVDLPPLQTHSEIEGEIIRRIPSRPFPVFESDREDTRCEVLALPIVDFDENTHFSKTSKYKSEVANLLKVKGGSHHVIELLGRTQDGKLVFPRHYNGLGASRVVDPLTIAVLKRWSVQLAEAVCFLHSIGIIHRDIHTRNVLVTKDYGNMILCDFECRWGSDDAPEISPDDWHYERPYTEKSDVFCFGKMLNDIIMGDNPRNPWVAWSAPAPFSSIVEACKAEDPADRPTMQEVKLMLEAIPEPDCSQGIRILPA